MDILFSRKLSTNMKRHWASALFLAAPLLLGGSQAMAVTSYVSNGYLVELLDDVAYQHGRHIPRKINEAGEIAGEGVHEEGVTIKQAMVWAADGTITNLDPTQQENYSSAWSINNSGIVVGHYNEQPAILMVGQRALVGGVASRVGTAKDINDDGDIVGITFDNTEFSTYGHVDKGFISQGGVVSYLEGLPASGEGDAQAINQSGQVAGSSELDNGESRAVIWNNGVITNLGVLPGYVISYGEDINDAGDVVGDSRTSEFSGISRPVLWQNGSIIDLGGMGGTSGKANAINNAGQIVGWSRNASGIAHPFLWQNGVMTDLAPLLQGLCSSSSTCGAGSAQAINNAGQIVGTTSIPGLLGVRAYRLTPVTSSAFDLGVTMTANAAVINVGDQLDYTITATNMSNLTGSGVSVVDNLPNGLDLLSATSSQGSCSGTTTVICDLGNLAGSSQATVSISVTANSAGTFTNLVNVSANETETDMANNMATHMVDVQDGTPPPPPPAENADMEVKLDVSTEKARVGDTVTYTATVKNKGPGLASGAELNNALPSSLSFVSANTSQGSCGGGSTVSCSLGELSANSTVIVQIVVTVVKRERKLKNTVMVQSQTADPDTGNNSDTVKIRVRR